MLWAKALHLIFMVTWFAGLFYLPRLFVYHSMATDSISIQRFKIMERKLYFGIMTPGAVLTILFGLLVISYNPHGYMQQLWLHIKLGLVALLVAYHLYLGKCYFAFKKDKNTHGHVFYRFLNEVPVIFLVAIILLAVIRPFGLVTH
jgi:putative membrane protein